MNMKKVLCALMALFAWASQTMAADGISAADVSVPQGGTAVLEVQLESVVKSYGGFQFDLKLPAGISATKIEKADRLLAIDGYTLNMNLTDAENNTYTVLGYNSNHETIPETSGTVVYITLAADAGLAVDATLTAEFQNVVVSTVEPENIDAANSSFTITIGEPADPRTVLDETSTSVPAAATGVDVRVKRTINANEWSTICLPFAMTWAQVESAFGEDVQLADFVNYDITEEGDDITGITINFTDVTTGIEANHPYIIKVSSAITEFTADGVDIDPDEENAYVEYNNGLSGKKKVIFGTFEGTLHAGKTLAENTLFLAENKFWYSAGATVIKGFRAYFDLTDVLSEVEGSGARIMMDIDGEETSIENIRRADMNDDAIYDLQGRRVEHPAKGIYIKNGKKVVIK